MHVLLLLLENVAPSMRAQLLTGGRHDGIRRRHNWLRPAWLVSPTARYGTVHSSVQLIANSLLLVEVRLQHLAMILHALGLFFLG